MSQPYSQKEVPLESDDRLQMKGLVEEIKDRLRDLTTLVSRVGDVPLSPDDAGTRFEVRQDSAASDSGVIIVGLPTDPPMLACGYYQDGEYTKIVVPCTEIHIGDVTIEIDIH